MGDRIQMKKYTQFHGNNPFGSQAKMLFLIDRLYKYLYKGDCYPSFMEINLTNKCNMKCYWCISENFRSKDTLNKQELFKFLAEFKNAGGKAITFSGGGEPTNHPDFLHIIDYTWLLNLDIGLMTNGVYPTKYNKAIGSKIKWVRFSVDTVNQKKYKAWKGVDEIHMVKKNIELLRQYNISIGVNCNVNMNHSWLDVIGLIRAFNNKVNYIQFRPILPRYFKNEKSQINNVVWFLLELIDKFFPKVNISNDKLKDIKEMKFFQFEKCDGHFFEPILNANGDICTCMYHPNDKRFAFGNIKKQSFKEIWNSAKRQKVIKFIRSLDYSKECQACCKLAEPNKFLDFIMHPERVKDVNFL